MFHSRGIKHSQTLYTTETEDDPRITESKGLQVQDFFLLFKAQTRLDSIAVFVLKSMTNIL